MKKLLLVLACLPMLTHAESVDCYFLKNGKPVNKTTCMVKNKNTYVSKKLGSYRITEKTDGDKMAYTLNGKPAKEIYNGDDFLQCLNDGKVTFCHTFNIDVDY